MSVMPRLSIFLLLLLLPAAAQAAPDRPWRASLYGGIATRNDTTDIFLKGHFHPDGARLGVALDRELADLGAGFTLEAELAAATFLSKGDETSVDLGLGVRYSFDFLGNAESIALMTGPSFADQPPSISTGTWHGAPIRFKRMPWLNYVGGEVAAALTPRWNAVLRYYHRSGAFGLFAPNADEGSTFALGLQYRF
jgi:hypothetical protein